MRECMHSRRGSCGTQSTHCITQIFFGGHRKVMDPALMCAHCILCTIPLLQIDPSWPASAGVKRMKLSVITVEPANVHSSSCDPNPCLKGASRLSEPAYAVEATKRSDRAAATKDLDVIIAKGRENKIFLCAKQKEKFGRIGFLIVGAWDPRPRPTTVGQ
jgi:hypothetical protein